ncbi:MULTISPECIES: zinc dependent phospholipase C family protein [unclassified Sedimentibacter]|uniref:zinc dependent phospholipase C family protein n=1 Tax=unclassified Sedimentibacter TaxID=2649220 RepID=UPI0027E0C5AF|nr:zinc dependent phospholipase C family protein [Sedimentibacter sp. MB35-C1]WMJ76828.1 zinc dependent phospholipase C family protein [Sedimentibacter sp. MB35-C1]
MPTTYAHYTFGQEVLKLIDEDINKIINKNKDLFNIGLHGPDILFYYKPLKSNRISKVGHNLHERIAADFFGNAKDVINASSDYEASLSYIFGFICHFVLDSHCHPYIIKNEGRIITHSHIETEFDRVLMLKDNLNPVLFRPTSHIKCDCEYSEVISSFYKEISKGEIKDALKSMKQCLNFLVAPGRVKRNLLMLGLKISGNYENMVGLLMSYSPIEECNEMNEKLYEIYNESTNLAAEMVDYYYRNLKADGKLDQRFNRNFL